MMRSDFFLETCPYQGECKNHTPFMTKNGQNWLKSIPHLWPKRLKNHTLLGCTRTYLYSPYKGVPRPAPPPPYILFIEKRYPFHIRTLETCTSFLSPHNEVNEQYYGKISSIIRRNAKQTTSVIYSLHAVKRPISLPFYIPQLVKSLPFYRQTDRHVCLFGVLYNKYTSTLTK